jgi:hypothetical protein
VQQCFAGAVAGECRGQQRFLRPAIALENPRQAPRRHHTDPVADQHQFAQVARHHHERATLASQRAHQAINIELRADVDAARRFVE